MTRHAYLFIYDDDAGAREEIRGYIDKLPEILNWRCDMPHAFYLVSECSAREVAEKIRSFTGDEGRFLVSEVTGNKQGWLPKRRDFYT